MSLAKSGGQYQVVVGSDVPNVYRALEGLLDLDEVSKESSKKHDRTRHCTPIMGQEKNLLCDQFSVIYRRLVI